MHILKLALPIAGVLFAGQALSHKAPRPMTITGATTRLAPAQTDTSPAALLQSIGGKSAYGSALLPMQAAPAQPEKGSGNPSRNNHSH